MNDASLSGLPGCSLPNLGTHAARNRFRFRGLGIAEGEGAREREREREGEQIKASTVTVTLESRGMSVVFIQCIQIKV